MKAIEAIHLAPWEERALPLIRLIEVDGFLKASDGKIDLCLPLELKGRLSRCLGARIAVLRTDSGYCVRILDEKSEV